MIAAPPCAALVAATAGFAAFPQLGEPNFTGAYAKAFVDFIESWLFMFLLGSLFGKVMEATGAADSVAWSIAQALGPRVAGAGVLVCAVLRYGGVSVFIVAFTVNPIAIGLFRLAHLPRRFIAGCLGLGSITFTVTSAGSPEIQNWIPIKYLGTTAYAPLRSSLFDAKNRRGLRLPRRIDALPRLRIALW